MKIYKLLPICSLLFFAACGNDSSSASSDDPESSSSEESLDNSSSSWIASSSSNSRNDVDVSSSSRKEEKSSSSKGEVSSSSQKSGALTDPLKIFKTRKPKAEVYTCKSSELNWEEKFDQQDWICSFKYDGDEGFVYVQSSPTDCEARFSMIPVMSVDTAAFYVNGEYETLKNVTYEWGGNHHNDSFRFSYKGKVFEYFHSSYGWGGRSCQEMDCLKVYESDGETLIEDGCGTFNDNISQSRSLPVVCRFASVEDGSFDSFTDTFEICMGDFRIPDPAE
ncbi:hypothetical protein [Fibrobacter sp.]|uniref:hypothetical protein n=1 Tax=Fibrobacter sp. TaxID=35828 RepID=UPI00386D413E